MMLDRSALHPNSLVKYPRTPHLPSSPGATSDDKWATPAAIEHLSSGIELAVTEKMDGGSLTFAPDHFYSRSIDSGTHVWDTAARALWASVRHDIPEGWRVCGESMYARRSVAYESLPGIFMVFSVWNESNTALSWDETEEWASLLGLPVVPTLYRGTSLEEASNAWFEQYNTDVSEGFVVRNASRFSYEDFSLNTAKWVRADHVRTRADFRDRDDFSVNTFSQ